MSKQYAMHWLVANVSQWPKNKYFPTPLRWNFYLRDSKVVFLDGPQGKEVIIEEDWLSVKGYLPLVVLVLVK